MTRGMAYAVVAVVAMAVLAVGAPVSAQQPGHPPGAEQPGQPSPEMMQMCHQMMMEHAGRMGGGMMGGRGMMGGGMMGMMGMMPMMGGDPKQQAENMAMRGEMMKAMGDIMMKYAERMRTAK